MTTEGDPSTALTVGEMAVTVLSLREGFMRIKAVLVLMLFVGFVSGVPSGYEPNLQQDAYGDNMFLISGGISAAKGVWCAIFNSVVTSLSDRWGRKGAILISQSMAIVPYAVFVATNNFWAYAMADMVLGMYAAALVLSMAVITDRIPRECGLRTECFALCVGMFFIGLGVGPFSTYVVTQTQAFVFSLCLQSAAVVWVALAFPDDSDRFESFKAGAALDADINDRPSFEGDAALPLVCPYLKAHSEMPKKQSSMGLIVDTTRATLAASKRVLTAVVEHPQLAILCVAVFFNYLSIQVLEGFMNLFLMNPPLNFTPNQQTNAIAIVAGAGLISLFFLTSLMKRFLGLLWALRVALVANAFQLGLFAFIKTAAESYAVPVLGILAQATYPCASAIATTFVVESDIGAALGAASAARMLAEATAPLAFGAIFNAAQNVSFAGYPFLIASGCVVIALGLTFLLKLKESA